MKVNAEKPVDVVAVGSWTNFDHLYVVDRLPEPGDTVQVIHPPVGAIERVFFGGCAPNNAAAAAKLGARAALVGVVGRDFRERGYLSYLEQLGVNLNGTILVEDDLCGHSFLYSDPEGRAMCLSHLGIAARQEDFEPNCDVLSQAKVTVINYKFDRYTLRAARVAHEAGSLVVVSGALMTAPEHASAFVNITDLLVCTDHELDRLVQHLGLVRRDDLFARGVRVIIATRGKAGSCILVRDGEIQIPVVPTLEVVDPVGAGDGFVGGLAAGLARGFTLADAARLGASVASFVVEAWGCQTNLPTFAQAAGRVEEAFGVAL